MAEAAWLRKAGESAACQPVRNDGSPVDTVRGSHFAIWLYSSPSDGQDSDRFAVCDDVPELYEAGESALVSDIPDR